MTTPKRPRDTNQLAKMVVDMATDDRQVAERVDSGKSAAHEFASEGGVRGGRARADALSPTQRSDIARAAALARWSKPKT